MLHFIALRKRIKVTETIQKITSAMRLMSRSLHARLRNQKSILEEYTAAISNITHDLEAQAKAITLPPSEDFPQFAATNYSDEPIIIVIGSQKGLCGIFNENVFMLLEEAQQPSTAPIITVGKRATDYLRQNNKTAIHSFDHLNIANFTTIASQLTTLLLSSKRSKVLVFSNISRSFFVQKAHMTELIIPVLQQHEHHTMQFLNYTHVLQLKVQLLHIIYESLLSEQAARFISMDAATRNADDVIEQTKINYNKTRQAHVTRELTELSASTAHEVE